MHSQNFSPEPTCTDEDILRWLNEPYEEFAVRSMASLPPERPSKWRELLRRLKSTLLSFFA